MTEITKSEESVTQTTTTYNYEPQPGNVLDATVKPGASSVSIAYTSIESAGFIEIPLDQLDNLCVLLAKISEDRKASQ